MHVVAACGWLVAVVAEETTARWIEKHAGDAEVDRGDLAFAG